VKNFSTVRQLQRVPRLNMPKGEKVVQIRGRGFNKSGFDARADDNIKPIPDARVPGGASASPSSYLPTQGLAKGGKVQAMKYGKGGKVISCQNY
jgi:hypothetical protein